MQPDQIDPVDEPKAGGLTALTDPTSSKFKIFPTTAPAGSMNPDEARAWLAQPVTPRTMANQGGTDA